MPAGKAGRRVDALVQAHAHLRGERPRRPGQDSSAAVPLRRPPLPDAPLQPVRLLLRLWRLPVSAHLREGLLRVSVHESGSSHDDVEHSQEVLRPDGQAAEEHTHLVQHPRNLQREIQHLAEARVPARVRQAGQAASPPGPREPRELGQDHPQGPAPGDRDECGGDQGVLDAQGVPRSSARAPGA